MNRFTRTSLINPLGLVSLILATLIIGACNSDDNDKGNVGDAQSDVLFDESIDGDIIDDPNNPHPLQLATGKNVVRASMVAPDLDYITVNVPAGSQLTEIIVESFDSTDDVSFIAIQAGSVFTEPAATAIAGNLLGYLHFGVQHIGEDILSNMGMANGAQGLVPPLADGDYTFWIQETGSTEVSYVLNFVVSEAS